MTFAHLIKCGYDLVIIGGIQGTIENKVGFHGFDPLGGVGGFS